MQAPVLKGCVYFGYMLLLLAKNEGNDCSSAYRPHRLRNARHLLLQLGHINVVLEHNHTSQAHNLLL